MDDDDDDDGDDIVSSILRSATWLATKQPTSLMHTTCPAYWFHPNIIILKVLGDGYKS
jgi:hypothetical protein